MNFKDKFPKMLHNSMGKCFITWESLIDHITNVAKGLESSAIVKVASCSARNLVLAIGTPAEQMGTIMVQTKVLKSKVIMITYLNVTWSK